GFAKTLRDPAHGVFRAGAVLHAEGANGLPGRDARDRVRHVQPDALLPHHDRADAGVGGVLDQVVDRIAAEDLDPLALHDFRDCRAELHGRFSPQGPAVCPTRPVLASWNRNFAAGKARFAARPRSPDMRKPLLPEPNCRAPGERINGSLSPYLHGPLTTPTLDCRARADGALELGMRKFISKFLADQSGATAIEYCLIAAGISIVILVAVNGIGTTLNGNFTSINSSLK